MTTPTMEPQQARRLGRPPSTVAGRTVPERLLEASVALFADKGFEGTSVADIVESAGVTKGGMYHYFASKEDLLQEIYARVLRMQMERLQAVMSRELPVAERLWMAAADVVATSADNLDSTVIFFRSLHALSEERQRQVRAERRRYHEAFRSLIIEGQQAGEFRADVDADLAVDFFFGSVHHLPTWWTPQGTLSGADVGSSFADLLLRSLAPG